MACIDECKSRIKVFAIELLKLAISWFQMSTFQTTALSILVYNQLMKLWNQVMEQAPWNNKYLSVSRRNVFLSFV